MQLLLNIIFLEKSFLCVSYCFYNVCKKHYLVFHFQIETSFHNSLGSFRFDSLFDYGNELKDIKAVNLVNGYYSYLMQIVQPRMQEVNRKRKENDDLTYPYLIPRWLPNGIQT